MSMNNRRRPAPSERWVKQEMAKRRQWKARATVCKARKRDVFGEETGGVYDNPPKFYRRIVTGWRANA